MTRARPGSCPESRSARLIESKWERDGFVTSAVQRGHGRGQARARLRGDKFLAVSRPQHVAPTGPLVLPTREGYDRWAEIYDGDGNPLIALEEPEVDQLLGDVAGLDLVDVGCGTGRHALRLAARGANVTGV